MEEDFRAAFRSGKSKRSRDELERDIKHWTTFYEIEIDYHIRMRDRYARAALRPCLHVPPDPYPGWDRVNEPKRRGPSP